MQQPGAPPAPYPPPAYPYPGQYYAPAPPRRTNGKAVAAMILGIAGILLVPLVPAIIAVVLGHGARREIRADPLQQGDGFALTGLILGWIGIAVVALIALVFLFILFILGVAFWQL